MCHLTQINKGRAFFLKEKHTKENMFPLKCPPEGGQKFYKNKRTNNKHAHTHARKRARTRTRKKSSTIKKANKGKSKLHEKYIKCYNKKHDKSLLKKATIKGSITL